MARYDGPPGLMLDLTPASPDGVDLEWIHPYTYVLNNPVNLYDPEGLAPRKKPKKPKVTVAAECKCVWKCKDNKGNPSTSVEPSGLGQVSYSTCLQYCNGAAGSRTLVKLIWNGKYVDVLF